MVAVTVAWYTGRRAGIWSVQRPCRRVGNESAAYCNRPYRQHRVARRSPKRASKRTPEWRRNAAGRRRTALCAMRRR